MYTSNRKRGGIKFEKENKKKTMLSIIILTIIIIILSTHIVYAKYITVDKISSSLRIAKPIFIVEGGEATKTSETGFLYTIEIFLNTDETIQFELYNEDIQIPLENLKTEKLSISGNEKIEQKYKLKVMYDSSKGNSGQDILEEVQVKVHSEQEQI